MLEPESLSPAYHVIISWIWRLCSREEQEKQNIWIAYLNLENLYGSPETLQAVFDRALQYNDKLSMYNQLIQIYVKSGKLEVRETTGTCLDR